MGSASLPYTPQSESWQSQMPWPVAPESLRQQTVASEATGLPLTHFRPRTEADPESGPPVDDEISPTPPLFQSPPDLFPPLPAPLQESPSDPPLPAHMTTQQVAHYEIGTPTPVARTRHHCRVRRAKFTTGESICRLYDDHCFHEARVGEKFIRET